MINTLIHRIAGLLMRYVLVMCLLCSFQSTYAGTVTGTFQGIADIEVQQYVLGKQVGPTVDYKGVVSTLNFTITANSQIGNGPFQFDLTNNIFSLDSTNPDPIYRISPENPLFLITFITDGIPGQSSDLASGSINTSIYHLWYLEAGVSLTDPTGEYIGNGDTSNVLVTANYIYQPFDSNDTGQTYTVSFTNSVPEPSSIVLWVTGLLIIWSVKCISSKK